MASMAGRINAVMILLFFPAIWTVGRNAELRNALLPFIAAITFVLLTVPLVLNSRLGLGIDQPYYASRYASIAPLWPV